MSEEDNRQVVKLKDSLRRNLGWLGESRAVPVIGCDF